tara:strand:- start:97 stop:939 length:843 start_codon:yes stop_codon:yes gene_type:complete
MKILDNQITFLLVAYKSEHIIDRCLNSLPTNCKKIIVENSQNNKFTNYLKLKYKNIKILKPKKNLGYGKGNNLALEIVKTHFAYIINPDVELKKNSLLEMKNAIVSLNGDFTILAPNTNYSIKKNGKIKKNIEKVEHVLGAAMLLNLKNYKKHLYFDKNIFLFMEEIDLCKRVNISLGKIYKVNKSHIYHQGKQSTNYSYKVELLRNWHYMWSYFYFNKKHSNFLLAFTKSLKFILRHSGDLFLSILILNKKKFKMSYYRISGILNSIFGRSSYLRLEDI